MQWLQKIVDEVEKRTPKGEVLIESGASPSGTYHLGHLREIITCDAIRLELIKRGRTARHVHFVDDLDALRKVPVNIPAEFEKELGKPLCDIKAPDDSEQSYADYFVNDFIHVAEVLGIEMEVIRSHEKYRAGFFVSAIEKTLADVEKVKDILSKVSGHKVDDNWSPIQVKEGDYLKSRKFVSIDTGKKELTYEDSEGQPQTVSYAKGEVKLNWRVDWAARWWLLDVNVEPAGRDHASAGGSFDTGLAIVKEVFGVPGPLPVPYDFINRAGDNKKMSASKGTGISINDVAEVLPPEVVRYFVLRFPPAKRLYFDEQNVAPLIDEFAAEDNKQLIKMSLSGLEPVVSGVPFTHLVASYQSALKDSDETLEIIRRTEGKVDETLVKRELKYIEQWLKSWAPDDVKFELREEINAKDFSDAEKQFLGELAEKIGAAPKTADGEWFHKAIYEIKEEQGLEPNFIFPALYKALIGKEKGPRAGWFLSILPREWLIKRLKLEA
jgi:lysyl-tRNA synthetase class 1